MRDHFPVHCDAKSTHGLDLEDLRLVNHCFEGELALNPSKEHVLLK